MPAVPTAFFGLFLIVAGLLLAFVMPSAAVYGLVLQLAGLVGLIVAAIAGYARLRAQLKRRGAKSGIGIGLGAVLFIAIVAVVNAISLSVNARLDLTGLSQFTLTSQTKEVLRKIDAPIEITSFFSPGPTATVRDFARNLIHEYELASGRIGFTAVDPDLRPDLARQYGIDRVGALVGTVVFSGPKGRKNVFGPEILSGAEHAFTSALLEVTGQRQKAIYFLTGHGEQAVANGLGQAAEGLRDNLFRVADLDLVALPSIPDDAAAVVVANPSRLVPVAEIERLKAYAAAGGNVLVLLDPEPRPEMQALLAGWGIGVEAGKAVEPEAHVVPNVDSLLVTRDRNEFGLDDIYLPGATAVVPLAQPSASLEIKAIAWTTPDAWLETSAQPGDLAFDPAADKKGPLAIGALRSETAPDANAPAVGRIAVMGDSDFATDPHFHNGSNGALFVAIVGWLTAGEQVASIDRKAMATRRLLLNSESARFLNLSSVALPPSLVLIAGLAVWWRRRRT